MYRILGTLNSVSNIYNMSKNLIQLGSELIFDKDKIEMIYSILYSLDYFDLIKFNNLKVNETHNIVKVRVNNTILNIVNKTHNTITDTNTYINDKIKCEYIYVIKSIETYIYLAQLDKSCDFDGTIYSNLISLCCNNDNLYISNNKLNNIERRKIITNHIKQTMNITNIENINNDIHLLFINLSKISNGLICVNINNPIREFLCKLYLKLFSGINNPTTEQIEIYINIIKKIEQIDINTDDNYIKNIYINKILTNNEKLLISDNLYILLFTIVKLYSYLISIIIFYDKLTDEEQLLIQNDNNILDFKSNTYINNFVKQVYKYAPVDWLITRINKNKKMEIETDKGIIFIQPYSTIFIPLYHINRLNNLNCKININVSENINTPIFGLKNNSCIGKILIIPVVYKFIKQLGNYKYKCVNKNLHYQYEPKKILLPYHDILISIIEKSKYDERIN